MENPYQPSLIPPPQYKTRGFLLTLFGVLWVFVITDTISVDFFKAPLWLKFVITSGHLLAIASMLYPAPNKAVVTWVVASIVSLWAALQIMVLWYWN